MSRLALASLVATFAASCGGTGPGAGRTPSTRPSRPCAEEPSDCTLRRVGELADVRVGAAVTSGLVVDGGPRAGLLAEQFDSVTPEFEGKWAELEPARGVERFGPLDAIVAFAGRHDMGVRGHVLVWDGDGELPDWVRDIDDPVQLSAEVERHIRSVVGRYVGRVDRWDVVNEPLETTGDELAGDHLLPVLGERYIAEAFRSARAADPKASLWLNENNVERDASKADALVDLVEGLVDEGVPIDGVGLQTHLMSGQPTKPGVIERLVDRFRDLGLDVAITELDVPRPKSGSTSDQIEAFGRVARECRRAGCNEITTWGVDNGHTWLDEELDRPGTDPLLFDADGSPTPAFVAVRDALSAPRS